MTGGRVGVARSREHGWQEMEGYPAAETTDEMLILAGGIAVWVAMCVSQQLAICHSCLQ